MCCILPTGQQLWLWLCVSLWVKYNYAQAIVWHLWARTSLSRDDILVPSSPDPIHPPSCWCVVDWRQLRKQDPSQVSPKREAIPADSHRWQREEEAEWGHWHPLGLGRLATIMLPLQLRTSSSWEEWPQHGRAKILLTSLIPPQLWTHMFDYSKCTMTFDNTR